MHSYVEVMQMRTLKKRRHNLSLLLKVLKVPQFFRRKLEATLHQSYLKIEKRGMNTAVCQGNSKGEGIV